VSLQLGNGLLRDVETKLALGLGEVDPELSPGAETVARREDVLHLLGGVPRVEGAGARVSIETRASSGEDILRICVQGGRHLDVWCSYHNVNRRKWYKSE
jgi:hypothetical protein